MNKVYNENCLITMKSIPSNSIDLIIADPPYNKNVAWWDKYTIKEYVRLMINCTKEFKRILSDRGNLFIYNQQPMASYMFCILNNHLNYVDEIIWYYKNGGSGKLTKRCKNAHQLLYWFSKNENDYIINLANVRQPYSGTRVKYKNNVDKNPAKNWTPNTNGALPTNVWEISIVRQKESTKLAKLGVQKPKELSTKIIKLASNENSQIYIPFAGSGSEIESCITNNRKWIASEIEKEYITDIITPRVNKIKEKEGNN